MNFHAFTRKTSQNRSWLRGEYFKISPLLTDNITVRTGKVIITYNGLTDTPFTCMWFHYLQCIFSKWTKKLMLLMPLFFSYRVEKTTRSQLVATYFLIKSIWKIFKLSTSVYYPCSLYVWKGDSLFELTFNRYDSTFVVIQLVSSCDYRPYNLRQIFSVRSNRWLTEIIQQSAQEWWLSPWLFMVSPTRKVTRTQKMETKLDLTS